MKKKEIESFNTFNSISTIESDTKWVAKWTCKHKNAYARINLLTVTVLCCIDFELFVKLIEWIDWLKRFVTNSNKSCPNWFKTFVPQMLHLPHSSTTFSALNLSELKKVVAYLFLIRNSILKCWNVELHNHFKIDNTTCGIGERFPLQNCCRQMKMLKTEIKPKWGNTIYTHT